MSTKNVGLKGSYLQPPSGEMMGKNRVQRELRREKEKWFTVVEMVSKPLRVEDQFWINTFRRPEGIRRLVFTNTGIFTNAQFFKCVYTRRQFLVTEKKCFGELQTDPQSY